MILDLKNIQTQYDKHVTKDTTKAEAAMEEAGINAATKVMEDLKSTVTSRGRH